MRNTTRLEEKSAIGSAWVVITCPETGKILLGKRAKQANNPGQWNLFGGGIEKTESPLDTALRELREEAGIQIAGSRLRKVGTAPGNITVYALDLSRVQASSAIKLNRAEVEKARWFALEALPNNLHKSTNALLQLVDQDELTPQPAPSMRRVMDMVEGRTKFRKPSTKAATDE